MIRSSKGGPLGGRLSTLVIGDAKVAFGGLRVLSLSGSPCGTASLRVTHDDEISRYVRKASLSCLDRVETVIGNQREEIGNDNGLVCPIRFWLS